MAKRISGSSVQWEVIAKLFKENNAPFLAFKSKTDKYLKRVVGKTPDLKKIDWAYYKAKVATPGFVDSFQKSYEGLQIPYPSDQGVFAKLENKEKVLLNEYKNDMKKLDEQIAEIEKKLADLNKEIPYSQMSFEEFFIARPDMSYSPDNPKLWPQNVDDEYLKSEKD